MVKDFTVPPAFGWQTKEYNAQSYYKLNGSSQKGAKTDQRWSNFGKVVEYVPGIGALPAALRVFFTIANQDKKCKKNHFLRAFVVIVGAGPLLFLVDLVTTIGRYAHDRCKSKPA